MYILKRYKYVIVCIMILLIMYLINHEVGILAIKGTLNNVWELIKLVPPVFVLLGLMDIWIPRERMMKFLGEESGVKGGIVAFLIGSFAAGPIYAAFPVAAMFLRKGASIKNVMIFTGAWASTKVPMLLIEISSLGIKFTLIRLTVEIISIIIIAYIINKSLSKDEKNEIYKNAKKL
ncbi:permease [Clostridium cibarium]|uniref:Permease n=1 Tax=Clostridium cibarium TaxID=2762247 RepID=A0ABR8PTH4_9CLOT|nr:permease [Clostridium cibarium]MBD7911488.1 permease [Clostridium cibarium]